MSQSARLFLKVRLGSIELEFTVNTSRGYQSPFFPYDAGRQSDYPRAVRECGRNAECVNRSTIHLKLHARRYPASVNLKSQRFEHLFAWISGRIPRSRRDRVWRKIVFSKLVRPELELRKAGVELRAKSHQFGN